MNLNSLKALGNLRGVNKALLTVKKYSPEILVTTGVLGTVTAAVLASKATLHLEPIIDEAQLKMRDAEEKTHKLTADEYSSTDHKRAVTKIYFGTAGKVAKLYAPSVTLGILSISCIVGSHGMLQRRNVALAAAYKGLETTFAKYRDRVVEEFGEDKEKDIRQGIRQEIVVKDGKEEIVNTIDPNAISVYSRIFDSSNPNWTQHPDYNLNFVTVLQSQYNDRLARVGHIFLNEVYEALGMERTRAGAVLGWVWQGEGDNFIDFGIRDLQSTSARTFGTDDDADCILLDFNVDGVILDSLPDN